MTQSKLPLSGKTVAVPEHRQIDELIGLLEQQGASTHRCPLVKIIDNPDEQPIAEWINSVIAGKFNYIILMTGEALRRLVTVAEHTGNRDEFVSALGRTKKVTRGPKPVKALTEIALKPDMIAEFPTTEGVLKSMAQEDLVNQTVGVTLFSDPNPQLVGGLEAMGATVETVKPYVYAPASDDSEVATLIDKMAGGEIDIITFTSSPQLDRLANVSRATDRVDALKRGLQNTFIAAVGPVVAETLEKKFGVQPDLCPERGFVMKNLVQQLVRAIGKYNGY